jgi:hypothetical protein
MNIEKIKKQYEYGNKIFNKIFNLSDEQLKLKLKDILNENYHYIIDNNSSIKRTIIDENPKKIEIINWDNLSIEWFGIDYIPENGVSKRIREFDKYFIL